MRYEILKYERIRNLRIENNLTQKQLAETESKTKYILAVWNRHSELSCGFADTTCRILQYERRLFVGFDKWKDALSKKKI